MKNRSGSADAGWPGFPIARISGIRIVADWSVLVIFTLVAVNLGLGVFPSWHPDWSPALVWALAIAAALLFFASILVHEFAHAIVARRYGIPVRRITLFVFGGMAHMEREPPSPRAELLMAAAGPLMSLALGVASTLLGSLLASNVVGSVDDPIQAARSVGPGATLLLWLGPVNILLGLFNLIPGFPLDGGRVLRAILWAITKDLRKATRWAAFCGMAVAWGLIAIGITSLFGGGVFQGLWFMLIGWFLLNAARASQFESMLQYALRNARVLEVMRRGAPAVDADTTIATLVRDVIPTSDERCFPVLRGEHFEGMVCIEDLRKIPKDAWDATPVSRIMRPASELPALTVDEPAIEALHKVSDARVDELPVIEPRDGSVLGFVRKEDILRWITLRSIEEQPA